MGHLLHVELGLDHPEPEWFDQPAIGQLTIGSFHELASFDTYNRNKSYPQQVRPFGFLTIAHPTASEIGLGSPRSLVAPYEPNPTVAMSRRGGSIDTNPTPPPTASEPATPNNTQTQKSPSSRTATTSTPTADTAKPKPPEQTHHHLTRTPRRDG